MNKYLLISVLSLSLFSGLFLYTSAQNSPTLTAALSGSTSPAKNVTVGSHYVDVVKINLGVSGGDVTINGIYINTDVSGGLSNFSNIYLYDADNDSEVGVYPNQSAFPNLIRFDQVKITANSPKTYYLKASTSPSAAGQVRVGFSGFTFAMANAPALAGVPIYGNTITFVDSNGNPISTPTPVPTPTSSPSPTPTPSTGSGQATPASLGFTSLAALNLKEGDTISAVGSNDPDIYIVNDWGYKRLFLNPVIFNFYGHLGSFANVKNIGTSTRDMLVTSGLFRNCETNDPKVYGIETTGEDTGILHWINTSGAQAVADDPEFFKKVFCINNNEFNWYQKGSYYTSVNQIPAYSR